MRYSRSRLDDEIEISDSTMVSRFSIILFYNEGSRLPPTPCDSKFFFYGLNFSRRTFSSWHCKEKTVNSVGILGQPFETYPISLLSLKAQD
ncbi:unnamed protein product [Timema podura]|uniref:Uncharacterized protein n=1 Tax=Timema podura TaxID=61482 RepID=A0ABN7PA98_TIMPD|nr:unnamed protein product [Timema podura]